MNRIAYLTLCIFNSYILYSQNIFETKNIKEYNYFYIDSVKGETELGNYNPTGILELIDGSLIISTEFSIQFPGEHLSPHDYKLYNEKSHISSGSIFKLNKQFEKQWEIIFKDKRVESIKPFNNNTILLIGERVEMNKFWVANIDSNGNIIWEKEFKNKSQSTISDVVLDDLNDIYVLIESEKLVPIQCKKIYGKRKLEFFKNDELDAGLYLIKLSNSGRRKWTTTLDKRKNCETFGDHLVSNYDNIYAASSYEGFKKRRNIWNKFEGQNIFEVNGRGKILNCQETKNNKLLFSDKGVISCTPANDDTLKIYRNVFKNLTPISQMVFQNQDLYFWIKKGYYMDSSKYLLGTLNHNLGYLLIALNENYELNGLWMNQHDLTCRPVDFKILRDNTLIVIGEKWVDINYKNVRFVNLIHFE